MCKRVFFVSVAHQKNASITDAAQQFFEMRDASSQMTSQAVLQTFCRDIPIPKLVSISISV